MNSDKSSFPPASGIADTKIDTGMEVSSSVHVGVGNNTSVATSGQGMQAVSETDQLKFNAMVGVKQLFISFIDILSPEPEGISAWGNIEISEDNRGWNDRISELSGTAFKLAEIALGDRLKTVMKCVSNMHADQAALHAPDCPDAFFKLHECDFPLDRLPPSLQDMANAIVKMEGVPSVMAASALMGAVSASLGNGLVIESKTDKTAYGNLFILLDAPSGVGKSGTSDRASQPIRLFEQNHQLKLAPREKFLIAEIAKMEKDQEAAENSPDSVGNLEKLRRELSKTQACKQVLVGDATTEKLAMISAANGGALASFSGEARGIIQVLSGRYQDGNANDSFYLSAYTGEPFKQDRVGRAAVSVDRPCLSVMWMVQPDAFDKLWSAQSFSSGGLLPRFLSCRTHAQIQHCSVERKVFPPQVSTVYQQVITDLLTAYRCNLDEPHIVKASAEARHIIVSYANRIADRRNAGEFSDNGDSFAARWAEQTWKVALVFHAVEHGNVAHRNEVSEKTALAALAVVSWFALQQIHLLNERDDAAEGVLEEKVLVQVNRLGRATASMIVKSGIVKKAAHAKTILERLQTQGMLESEAKYGSGRPTRYYFRPPNYQKAKK